MESENLFITSDSESSENETDRTICENKKQEINALIQKQIDVPHY